MSVLVKIEDAKLKSLQVEIKALTVSGKQMTLSVFRQLPEKSIWQDEEIGNCALIGIPWGKVNYLWGDRKDYSGFQLVWQASDILYRMHIPDRISSGNYRKIWPNTVAKLTMTHEELRIKVAEDETRAAIVASKVNAACKELQNLPQLYIAV